MMLASHDRKTSSGRPLLHYFLGHKLYALKKHVPHLGGIQQELQFQNPVREPLEVVLP